MFKVGDKVVAVNSFNAPKGTIGIVIAMRPEINPVSGFHYLDYKDGMLFQCPNTDIHIHGTPNTSWEYIEWWDLYVEEEQVTEGE